MWTPADDESWDAEAIEVRRDLAQWRAAHPRATLREIEQEVDRRLAAVRAGLIQTAALAGAAEAEPPACPQCGGAMVWDGTRARHLTTTHNEVLELSRRYARCPVCGTGLFPPR
jgi:predicted RNA-binding Zn-ribbon protein involved in translation (DUF1610 family)